MSDIFEWEVNNYQSLIVDTITAPVSKKAGADFTLDGDCTLTCQTAENILWPIDKGPLDISILEGTFDINTTKDVIIGDDVGVLVYDSLSIKCENLKFAGSENNTFNIYNYGRITITAGVVNLNSMIQGGNTSDLLSLLESRVDIHSPVIFGDFEIDAAGIRFLNYGIGADAVISGSYVISNSPIEFVGKTILDANFKCSDSTTLFYDGADLYGTEANVIFSPNAKFTVEDNSTISFGGDVSIENLDFTGSECAKGSDCLFNFTSPGYDNGYYNFCFKKGASYNDQFNAMLNRGFLSIDNQVVKDPAKFNISGSGGNLLLIGLKNPDAAFSRREQDVRNLRRIQTLLKYRRNGG